MSKLPKLKDLALYPEMDTDFSNQVIEVQKKIKQDKQESFLSRFKVLKTFSRTKDSLFAKKTKHENFLGH